MTGCAGQGESKSAVARAFWYLVSSTDLPGHIAHAPHSCRVPKKRKQTLRLKKARSLLLQTDMSVINVALTCGFSSPSHFSKCYRAFYGGTTYRERGVPLLETAGGA